LFENAGAVDESARYLRRNREAGAFVGADSGEVRGFVGAQQATELGTDASITSAIDAGELIIETAPDANVTAQPIAPARSGMYPPRLQVGFDFQPRPQSEVSSQIADRLVVALSLDASNSIEVLVEDGVAILRGEVPAERERRLSELLVRLEPGVVEVQNELTVRQRVPAALEQPPAPVRLEQR